MSDGRITYLCGGINNLSDAECVNWRQEAKKLLLTPTLDPMRRDYRGREHEAVHEIVSGDLEDIRNSHFLLINATRPSWGTAMEIVYAHRLHKINIAFVGDSPVQSTFGTVSPWLEYHCVICKTLRQAVSRINDMFTGKLA